MKRHDISIIGMKRMPTLTDVKMVSLCDTNYQGSAMVWDFCADTMPAPGTKAEWIPAREMESEEIDFDCVMWCDDDGAWYMPADIFIWVAA